MYPPVEQAARAVGGMRDLKLRWGLLMRINDLNPVGRWMRWRMVLSFRLDSHLGCSSSGQFGSVLERKRQEESKGLGKKNREKKREAETICSRVHIMEN